MWARVFTLVLGLWLMIAPDLLQFGKVISDNDHIIGPLIATFSIIAMSECTRNVRLWNLPLAAWLLLAPWILGYDQTTAIASDLTVGVLTLRVTFVKQKRKKQFGGGWAVLFKSRAEQEESW